MKNKVVLCLAILAGLVFLVTRSPRRSPDSSPGQPIRAPQETARAALEASHPAHPVDPAGHSPDPHDHAPALSEPQDLVWNRPVSEPAFAAFKEWVRRYREAPTAAAQAALEAEGIALARARQTAMADLVQVDPERALALAVPREVRGSLPASVAGLLEEPVTGRGNYQVLAVCTFPGQAKSSLPSMIRGAQIEGEPYEVFTHGRGLNYVTRRDVPLNGIAVDVQAATTPPSHKLLERRKLLALDPNPGRALEEFERAAALQAEPACGVCGKPTGTAVQVGHETRAFCAEPHAQQWVRTAAAGLDVPSGDPGTVVTAASSYSEGRKRMLLMRPIWSDYTGGMSTNEAVSHFLSFSNYMYELSQGQLVLAALGRGSDITPGMLLPGTVAQYNDTGLGSLYTTSRSVAQNNYGYDLSQYDFTYVCTDSRPAADYAGLGFVGSPGFHLANRSWGSGVSSHEFGHNLGLNHAHFWDTDRKSIVGAGQGVEYGDGDDPMGSGSSPNAFNSRYKHYLGWIPDSDIVDLNATGSGLYRLYAFDLDNSVGVRGLKFRRNATQNYWVQFRQRKAGRALTNGVQLLWTGNDNEGSYLLDARLKGVSDNNAVAIGRTFSDPSLNLHITPVGKGRTFPESMDVRVNVGTFPGNLAPTVLASVDLTNAAAGQAVRFTATATDPNGDELAYFWEFSDGEYSIDNSPTTQHAFAAAGEYTAHCTVSDMKGATARHTVLVRVGSATTFRISGRVVDGSNRALPGMRVSTDTGRVALTDSDGSFTLAGLAAGSYGLDAIEPVRGTLTFVHPTFNNPVVVGPNVSAADLIGVSSSLVVSTPLVGKTVTDWKYRDTGVDQGTAWRARVFNDSAWPAGRAPLGYPTALVNTVISFGPSSSSKYPTYYFRRPFVVSNPNAYSGVNVEVLRDDGVVLYLNGTEVFRNNMPSGTITFNTAASTRVDAGDYILASVNSSLLVPGTNVIAAEVHQADGQSSDVVLDVGVNAQSVSGAGGLRLLYLSSPADKSRFTTPASINLNATAFASVGSITLVEFFANGVKLGEDALAPYSFTWNNPVASNYTVTAVAAVSGGSPLTSPPASITVAPPAVPSVTLTSPGNGASLTVPTNLLLQATVVPAGAVISTVQFYADGALLGADSSSPYSFSLAGVTPGPRVLTAVARTSTGSNHTSPPVNISLVQPSAGTQLVSFGEVWKYLDDGSNQGTAWTGGTYDDRLWAAGPGRLGYGGDGEVTIINSGVGLPARPASAYFRKTFAVPNPALFGGLLLRLLRDDGAVVYLNGVEVFRDNLEPGLVNWNSLAVTEIDGAGETTPLEARLNSNLLVTGTNVLAVGVHLVNTSSPDLGFDLALIGLKTTPPSAVYLTQPADGARFVAPATITMTAYTGTGPAPASVAYYANGGLIGLGAATAPHAFVWNNAPAGTHGLVAVADFGGGQVLTSAALSVTVGARPAAIQPFFATLITAGSSWRYWDSTLPVGTGWAGTSFNDTSWPMAPARFGWGLDGERTPLTEGRVTTYFRRWFSFPNPGVLSEMLFQLARDDGAVVYLNGSEVFRSNMPGGNITANTFSLTGVSTPEETTYFERVVPVSGSGLLTGSNLVAVELHQSGPASSDAGFDLQLSVYGTTEARVYLTTPLEGSTYSGSTNTIHLEAIARGTGGASVSQVEFFADGIKLGERTAAPWQLTWNNAPLGAHTLTARSRDATGVTVESPPVSIGVGRTILDTTLIASNAVWKYLVTGVNQGTGWVSRTFNDGAWLSGAARLGYGNDGEQTPLSFGGNPNAKFITTYFRKSFVVPVGAVYTTLDFRLVRDDGAVVWLNGREVFRSNMPATPITYTTLASTTANGADEQTPFLTTVVVTNLPAGTNVVAVEVHQATADSSDLGFNLELVAHGYIDAVGPPRLTVEFADGAIEITWPNTALGYRVVEAPTLTTPAGNWTASSGSLVELPGRFVFTIPAPAANRFYRLRKP